MKATTFLDAMRGTHDELEDELQAAIAGLRAITPAPSPGRGEPAEGRPGEEKA